MIRCFTWFAAALFALPALAHKASDAYLTLERDRVSLRGQWDIALRDLDNAIQLDANGDGDVTWGEVRSRRADIAAYALSRLQVSSAGERCTLSPGEQLIDTHTDGTYAVIRFTGTCPQDGPTLALDYRLFDGLDPQHRGLTNFVEGGVSRSVVFSADAAHRIVGGDSGGWRSQFTTYVNEGIWHIFTGFDHILFLLSLLLPAVLVRSRGAWHAGTSFRDSFVDVAKVVTAFTVAHSITLTLAALSILSLPSRLVESGIALSVILAAVNNLFPVVANGRWMAAFGFGLLHGFGFAGALQDLGLPTGSLALSLAAFNLGVESGQLAIVLVFLPLAFALRSTWTYRVLVFAGGSVAISAIASLWLVERAFDVPLFNALAAVR
ncbi:MAG TPA: HupE/UreJ family protein [Casimicrobiaceae bacterium]|nr:HupE/UreJ family protein [Casimicrobiaceae bacterium]